MLDTGRTIVALSSGVAPSRRAIVRLSGPATRQTLKDLFRVDEENAAALLDSHIASSASLTCALTLDGRDATSLELTCYFWPDHRSFTGESSAELHLLGSLPLVESLIARLLELGCELANRGEFALRSFLAGKIDLTQAEAILGVIEADDENELSFALGQLAGNLSQPIRLLKEELVELVAHLEAGLDFVEEDIEFISSKKLVSDLSSIDQRLESILNQVKSRGTRNRTPQVVLVGLPNAGKSTLFNCLLDATRAIVTNQAGTTRDAITARVVLAGMEIDLVDTAGFEDLDDDSPRALAQNMLDSRVANADVTVYCIDQSMTQDWQWHTTRIEELKSLGEVLVVGTKADLARAEPEYMAFDLEVSCHQGEPLDELREAIANRLKSEHSQRHSDALHYTMIRCSDGVGRARAAIQRAVECARMTAGEELIASELRLSLDELSSVIGEVHTEDILGEIFGRFCIGK